MEGLVSMMILNYKSMKTLEILRNFKRLCEVDKLKLAIHLLESKYLHLDIDKEREIQRLEKRLIALEPSYATTITNFNNYKYLTFLSAQFMELSNYNRNILVTEILENIFKIAEKYDII